MHSDTFKLLSINLERIKNKIINIDDKLTHQVLNVISVDTVKDLSIYKIHHKLTEINLDTEHTLEAFSKLNEDFKSYYDTFKDKLSFWDTFLFGMFGNKDKLDYLNKLNAFAKEQSRELDKLKDYTQKNIREKLFNKEQAVIIEYLNANDKEYQDHYKESNLLKDIINEMEDLVRQADKTLSDISGSKSMEILDTFTKNKGIGLISYASTSGTNDSIKEFKDNVEKFYKYRYEDLSTINTIDLIEELMEINFGFDMMLGFMQLSALGNAEEQITEVKEEIEKELSSIRKVQSIIDNNLKEKRKEMSNFK